MFTGENNTHLIDRFYKVELDSTSNSKLVFLLAYDILQ
jgi:hypothetical protein